MSTITKWIIGLCVLVVLAVGGYYALIWTQGQIFDRESPVLRGDFNGVVVHARVNVTEKEFFGRRFTMTAEIQDLPVINLEGAVIFGWDPKAELRVTGIPADPILEKAVLAATPTFFANFNARFWPNKIYGTINPITVETQVGQISLGKTEVDSDISYASNVFSQRAEVDTVVAKLTADSFNMPNGSFGPFRVDASVWPNQPKMLNMDISQMDVSIPSWKFKVNSFNFHTNLSRKGSDYLQTYVLKSLGSEDFLGQPAPFGLKSDIVAQWPQKIHFSGLFSSIATGGQTRAEFTDRDLKELIRAFREGKASIVINSLEGNAQGVDLSGNGVIGDTQSQGVWADLKVNLKSKTPGKLLLLAMVLPSNVFSENNSEINANIVVKEDNDMLQILCNGQKMHEWPAKSILKELY